MRDLETAALRCRPLTILLGLAFGAALAPPDAFALGGIAWVNWLESADGIVRGAASLGDERVDVTFTGETTQVFLGDFPEPYWGPRATYLHLLVANPPPNGDAIVLAGGSTDYYRLSFSRVLADPVFAIASLGLTNASRSVNLPMTMEFRPPVTTLQVLGSGPNFYAGGQWSPFQVAGNSITGIESSGTVRVAGSFGEIEWRTIAREEIDGALAGTYLFNVGFNCDSYRTGPTPLVEASSVPGGCSAYNDRNFQQQARLDVRGTLNNLASGTWVQGDAVFVTTAGTFINNGRLTVGEGQTFASLGTVRNFGTMDVRGLLSVDGGNALNYFGTITLKGDNTFPHGGRMRVASGATFTSTGEVVLERGTRLQIAGGVFDSDAVLRVDGSDAILETTTTGLVKIAGPATVKGGIVNGGVIRVLNGGSLTFDQSAAAPGSTAPLDNTGVVVVESGGTLRVAGVSPGASGGGSVTSVRNGSRGTVRVDGTLQLDGQLENAGLVRVGGTGQIVAAGVGSFSQLAGGVLESAGSIRAENGGLLRIDGRANVAGLQSDADSWIETLAGADVVILDGGLQSEGNLASRGRLRLEGPTGDIGFSHATAHIDNRGRFSVGAGATLTHTGPFANSGIFVVETGAELVLPGASTAITQSPDGVFVQNGRVTSSTELVVFGGRWIGDGTYDAPGVTFGSLEFDTDVGPGNSPGTLTFAGDLTLVGRTTITMEFTDHDGGDRLVVGGRLHAGSGSMMKLVFAGDEAPGLDQIFDFLVVGAGQPRGLSIEGPDGVRLDFVDRGATAAGGPILGVAFAAPDAMRLTDGQFDGGGTFFNPDGQYFVDGVVGSAFATIHNNGVIGIRNEGVATLEVGSFHNMNSGWLLNSNRFVAGGWFLNEGFVKNRADATFVYRGELSNSGRFENRGTLLREGDGQIVNRGTFVVHGELLSVPDDFGRAGGIRNEGGRFEVRGSVSGPGSYFQTGPGAVTLVDGVLAADIVRIEEGLLTGSGRVVGPLVLDSGARFEPGGSVGTFTVEGEIAQYGGEIFIELASPTLHDRLVVTGDVTLRGLIRFRLADGYVPTGDVSWTWLEMQGGPPRVPSDPRWVVEMRDPDGGIHVIADNDGFHDVFGQYRPGTVASFADGWLAFSAPVPEPGTWALLLGGLGLVGVKARRRTVARAVAFPLHSRPRTSGIPRPLAGEGEGEGAHFARPTAIVDAADGPLPRPLSRKRARGEQHAAPVTWITVSTRRLTHPVIPAKAGIQSGGGRRDVRCWTPACAGVTG